MIKVGGVPRVDPSRFAEKQGLMKSEPKALVKSFEDMFTEVNNEQLNADKKIADLISGKSKDIPGTMVAMEKADVSLRLFMAVRNKAVSAYEEMMRMQV